MARLHSKRTEGGDEGNTGFGLPGQVVDHKPGFEREVAKQEAETGGDRRFRRSEEHDVPQESLAARIAKIRKEG